MFLWRQIQLSQEFSNLIKKKLSSGIKFCTTTSFASASQMKEKVCEVVVRSCTYFLVLALHAGYLRYYTALNQFVQFVEDRVRLLECSPASCLAPRKHFEEKCGKFITRIVNNKSPSHFGFDTAMQCRV